MGTLAAISGGLFVYFLIEAIFGKNGLLKDRAEKRITRVLTEERKPGLADEELSKPFYERIVEPFLKNLRTRIAKMVPRRGRESESARERREKLRKRLRRAGMIINPEEYSLISLFVILGTALLFGLISLLLRLGIMSLLGAVLGAYIGFMGLRLNISFRTKNRKGPMERQMPDVLDMLSLNVEAGLGFEQAMLQVIKQFEGPLIDELMVTYREITMGRPRRDAMMLFAERCDIEEITVFASSIVQAEKLGISMKNVLRTQALAMRESRRTKVQEKAQKVQVKILFPMIFFIFPVLLISLLGPAIVKVIETL